MTYLDPALLIGISVAFVTTAFVYTFAYRRALRDVVAKRATMLVPAKRTPAMRCADADNDNNWQYLPVAC